MRDLQAALCQRLEPLRTFDPGVVVPCDFVLARLKARQEPGPWDTLSVQRGDAIDTSAHVLTVRTR
jgi:hypothetical protein